MSSESLLRPGSIEIITGSMFSGKTEELLRRLKRAQIARLKTEIFKPVLDTRFDDKAIVSHDLNSALSSPVENSASILLLGSNADVVAIDEAQFFDMELVDVCEKLANKGIRVIVTGLDMDYKGKPFGPIPHLMAIAEDVLKLHAVCVVCGRAANFSYRSGNKEQKILLGDKENYEPRCRICFHLDK